MAASSVGRQIASLNAIRGLAAVQVLLLHFASAFAPDLVVPDLRTMSVGKLIQLSPLALLYDGNLAVYIFFCLSGYVLTAPFLKRTNIPVRVIAARLVRLGLPAIAACAFSAALYLIFGNPNFAAGRITQSVWYATQWVPDMSWPGFLKDAVLNGMFLGYALMPPGIGQLASLAGQGQLEVFRITQDHALAPVLWTLSLEFVGSIVVFLLCWVRQRSAKLGFLILYLACILFCRSYLLCFLVGHFAATQRFAERDTKLPLPAALALVIVGAALAIYGDVEPHLIQLSQNLCAASPLYPCAAPTYLSKVYASILILAGCLSIMPLRNWLSGSHLDGLGAISFPLYLTHWPILFGPVAAILLVLAPLVGVPLAEIVAVAIGLTLCLAAAFLFRPVDTLAMRAAQWMQGSLRSRSTLPPAPAIDALESKTPSRE